MRRLGLYPAPGDASPLVKGMAGADAGPYHVSGMEMESFPFDLHIGFAAERKVTLFDGMVVGSDSASDGQFAPHHVKMMRP